MPNIHDCLMQFTRRAERVEDEKLVATFVDAAPLLASISSYDNQIIYGRRGTGKTHVIKYLGESKASAGDITLFIDLRAIGSNGSIYADYNKTIPQRATPLLLDVLQAMHEELLTAAIDRSADFDLSVVGPLLDDLADSISQVKVVGTVEASTEDSAKVSHTTRAGLATKISASDANVGVDIEDSEAAEAARKTSTMRKGVEEYYVSFSTVQNHLRKVIDAFKDRRLWVLLDEWSEIPQDIQPYLADLIRRCIFPIAKITTKITAIEHRTRLLERRAEGYVGIEVGADAGADVNLDDFMVFDNDANRSKLFFSNLLFKHYRASEGLGEDEGPKNANDLIGNLFTQITAFEEFVRATEGVPRDAVYLASTVARKAYGRAVSVDDVRAAARDWYQNDKSTALNSDERIYQLLHWIIEEVIGHRKARAFLLRSNEKHPLIDLLFDARLVHILKRNVSSHDTPGVRYDVYKLDYGCYVDLITTAKAPQGLLPFDDAEVSFVEVPPDDYRAIRRAILDITDFEKKLLDSPA